MTVVIEAQHQARRLETCRWARVPVDLVGVAAAEFGSVLGYPVGEDDSSGRGSIGIGQAVSHRAVFLAGEQRVAQHQTKTARQASEQCAGDRHHDGVTTDSSADGIDQLPEGHALRTNGVEVRVIT